MLTLETNSFNYYKHRQVLITGVAGFLGSHLADALLEIGASVVGVDNLVTGKKSNLAQALTSPRFSFIQADVVNDPASYLPPGTKFDIIFHFASPASPPQYQKHPITTYQVNSLGTHQLLSWLEKTNPDGRFLFASSSEVYGQPEVHPQPESYWGNVNPNGPRACYDEGKRLGETICGVWEREKNLDVRIMRFFNTYGPRLDPDDGRVVSNFFKQALAKKPLTIYGEGTQTRSYCYVDDLIDGVLLMGAKSGLKGKTINLGNPEEYTVRETANIIWKAINSTEKLKLEFKPMPKDDPTKRKPDITKAKKLLGWQPKVSFREGVKLMLKMTKHQ